jgi:hypothetical protein
VGEIPSEATFSRAFAEFAAGELPQPIHAAPIHDFSRRLGHVPVIAPPARGGKMPVPLDPAQRVRFDGGQRVGAAAGVAVAAHGQHRGRTQEQAGEESRVNRAWPRTDFDEKALARRFKMRSSVFLKPAPEHQPDQPFSKRSFARGSEV